MKRILRIAAIVSVFLGSDVCAQANPIAPDIVERGRYLALAADCVACHTAPGGAPYAGGRPLETPFGVIYSRNLTPDRETGLGLWSNADFYRALHKGLSRDGSHLYPAFPYPYFTQISEPDVAAIKAYLDTLAPVKNVIPPPRLPWPISQRGLMAIWNALFFHEGSALNPDRGSYLVEALGHCGACHTPKNFLGADKSKRKLQGGEILNWFAPSHAADMRSGLGSWSAAEIVEYLKSGRNIHSLAGGPMAEVVELSTSQLTESDLLAMADYLKRLPPAGRDAVVGKNSGERTMRQGEAIFIDDCAGCHRTSGEASPRALAPLKGSAVVQSENPLDVVRLILQGTRAAATEAGPTPFTMPAFGWKLTDGQVAAVATYVRNSWGNVAPPVSAGRVETVRRKIAKEVATEPP
jgi:mono/diheme cytochrome c family protein